MATTPVRWPLLALAAACAAIVAGLTALVMASPRLQLDISIERAIQSINLAPLAVPFHFFSWVGGPGGIYMELSALALVLILNRRAWLMALAVIAGGYSYFMLVNFVHRPRPTVDQVLRVTEHPGGSSFPSGHVIFITLSVGLILLVALNRHLSRRARLVGWTVAAAIVLSAAISRIYVGAHWPTDVAASLAIATGWLALVTSVRWLSDRALYRGAA